MTETYIGTRIRLARRARGLSQRQLAQQLDISVRTLRAYEQNKRVPDGETLQKVATVLTYPVEYFFRGKPAVETGFLFVCRLDDIFWSSNDY